MVIGPTGELSCSQTREFIVLRTLVLGRILGAEPFGFESMAAGSPLGLGPAGMR
jgi:hypothetical protein